MEPITTELRKLMTHTVDGFDLHRPLVECDRAEFERLCDQIDAVHEGLERENDRLKCELDRVLGEMDEHHAWAPESHYMMLPKDADGEPIHVGDVMEWVRYKDDDQTIVRTVSGIGNGVFFAWSDEQGRYAQYEAHAYRHHTPDTWERIIEDARTCTGSCGTYTSVPSMRWTNETDALVARCKALAGDAE